MKQQKTKGVFEKDGSWWIRLPLPGQPGRYRREKIGSYREACAAYQPRLEELTGAAGPSLKEAFEAFFQQRPRVDQAYHCHGRYFLKRWGEGTRLADVAAIDVLRAWQEERRQERKPASVNHQAAFLSGVFTLAVERGWLPDHPIGKGRGRLPYLKVANRRTRYLQPGELRQLREALPEKHYEAVLFAMHTGLRRSEQWRLRWEDVSPRSIHVQPGKTGQSREVHLNPIARAILKKRRKRGLPTPFPAARPPGVSWYFNTVCQKLGLVGLTWHCLRHTTGTRLARKGVQQRVIQEILGHTTLAMSARYTHVTNRQQAQALDLLCKKRPRRIGKKLP